MRVFNCSVNFKLECSSVGKNKMLHSSYRRVVVDMFIKYPQAPKDCKVEGSLGRRSYKCSIRFIQDRTIMRECSGATMARWIQENFLQKHFCNSKPLFYSLTSTALFASFAWALWLRTQNVCMIWMEVGNGFYKVLTWAFSKAKYVTFALVLHNCRQWVLSMYLAGEGLLSSKIPSYRTWIYARNFSRSGSKCRCRKTDRFTGELIASFSFPLIYSLTQAHTLMIKVTGVLWTAQKVILAHSPVAVLTWWCRLWCLPSTLSA